MDGQRVEDLSRLYSLAGRVGGHDALKSSLREYIKSTGLQIVKDEEKVRGAMIRRSNKLCRNVVTRVVFIRIGGCFGSQT